jgi:hypothetical protein
MIPESMIIIENRLAEMFFYLPEMKNSADVAFKPTFMYGTQKQLLDFLRQNSSGKSVYPIIWLVYPYVETHTRSNVSFKKLTLVLAVETNSSMLNSQRMKETYEKVLIPLYDNIKHCFNSANISNSSDVYEVVKFPNYSESEKETENEATYIWDALKVSFDGTLNSNCLNPIYF